MGGLNIHSLVMDRSLFGLAKGADLLPEVGGWGNYGTPL